MITPDETKQNGAAPLICKTPKLAECYVHGA